MPNISKSITLVFCLLCLFGTSANAKVKFKHYLRFEYEGTISYGELKAGRVYEFSAAPFDGGTPTGTQYNTTDVKLLAPVIPGQVFAVELNYQSHAGNMDASSPENFAPLSSTSIAPDDTILMPNDNAKLRYQGEMVLIIGKQAKNVSVDDALDYVFGVTAGNDISQRDWQATDLKWLAKKTSQGFGPLGPVIVNGIDFDSLYLETRLNGEIVQEESSAYMIHNVAEIVSQASQYFTLQPGDIIFTGSPDKSGTLKIGDKVIVTLEGVGGLANKFVSPND